MLRRRLLLTTCPLKRITSISSYSKNVQASVLHCPFSTISSATSTSNNNNNNNNNNNVDDSNTNTTTTHKIFSSKAFTYKAFYSSSSSTRSNAQRSSQTTTGDCDAENNNNTSGGGDIMDEIDYEEKIMNCFETLGICPTTSIGAIKTAYRLKALETHPDSSPTIEKTKQQQQPDHHHHRLSFLELQEVFQTCLNWARDSSAAGKSSNNQNSNNDDESEGFFDTLRAKKRIMNAIKFKDSDSRMKLLKHHVSLLKAILEETSEFYTVEFVVDEDEQGIFVEKSVSTSSNNKTAIIEPEFKKLLREAIKDSPISEIEALSNFIQIYIDTHQNLHYFHQALLDCYGFRRNEVFTGGAATVSPSTNSSNNNNETTVGDDAFSKDFLINNFTSFTHNMGEAGSAIEIENFFTKKVQNQLNEVCVERLRKLKLQHRKETTKVADRVLDIFGKEIKRIEKRELKKKKKRTESQKKNKEEITTGCNQDSPEQTDISDLRFRLEGDDEKRRNDYNKNNISGDDNESSSSSCFIQDQTLELTATLRRKLSSVLELITPKSVIWNEMMMVHEKNVSRISLFEFEKHQRQNEEEEDDDDDEKDKLLEESDTDEDDELFNDENHLSVSSQITSLFQKRRIRSKTILGSQVASIIRDRGYHKLATVVDTFCIESHESSIARNDYHLDSLVRDLIDASSSSSNNFNNGGSSPKQNNIVIGSKRPAVGGDGGSSSLPLNNNKPSSLVNTVVSELDESTTSELLERMPKDLKSYRRIHRIA